MDGQERVNYERQTQDLRAELKKWESDWALKRGGSKPGRDDIKQNPDIASKYKQYNKLRDILAGRFPPTHSRPDHEINDHLHHNKRKQNDASLPPPQTPSKRLRTAHTPRKTQQLASDLSRTPSSTNKKLFSPVPPLPTSIGPTPQKDGRVLGLFDFLTKTPSKPAETGGSVSVSITTPLGATPSKRRHHNVEAQTPKSDRLLLAVTTPLHDCNGNSQRRTPSSQRVSKIQFSTPSFLRRPTALLPPVDENGEWGVGPLRLPRKPLGRGLSSVVAGLRKIEDEALDDELDVLRELEEMEGGEMFAAPVLPKNTKPPSVAQKPPAVEGGEEHRDISTGENPRAPNSVADPVAEVENGRAPRLERPEKPVLLGGFDDENMYDSSGGEQPQLGRDGQPLRVYKKKGQKRTTRRVNMRPTRSKRPDQAGQDLNENDSEVGGDDDVVPETQFDASKAAMVQDTEGLSGMLSDGSDPDGLYSDFGSDGGRGEACKTRPKVVKTPKETKTGKPAPKKNANTKGEEGLVKKAVRKVKATAHANFKRLKLRNSGAKGGPGHNSRFRRRG
ncbi:DNA replication/checkpoint protein [Lasiosphaeria ovina]|uniref:DNA replication regulator SLD2 n=1 Tax=Lasiosphaeria ovina TaxID=92902 RepID=A0AAE0KIC7_9PEZI|nr:DNA replication/checkpoint protein [Lasiosphaeria ovina]